jgi:amino acid transporter
MFFWLTIQWPSYVAGEMRDARKSILSAFLLAEIATFVLLLIVGAASMLAFGPNFWYAATYLSGIGKNPLPTAQMVLLDLGAPVIGNFPLIAIIFIIIAAANWFSGTFALLAGSRKIFAWSFDRLIPAKFSNVSDRFGTPLYAVLLICILTEIYTAFSYYGAAVYGILVGLGNIYTALFLGVAAVSAIVFPLRKQLFERMPPLVQKRLGPIPIISILGVVAFVSLASIFLIGQIIPAVQQGLNVGEAAWTLGSFFAGIPLYYIAKAYRRRSGLDLSMVYREIPPE